MQDNFFAYLYAFSINLRVGLGACLTGIVIGFCLVITKQNVPYTNKLIATVISIMRAFPFYILIFILLGALGSSVLLESLTPSVRLEIILILAIAGFAAPACADLFTTFFEHRRHGEIEQSYLIVPNLFGVFIVSLICSSAGAAIGVHEAVNFTRWYIESLDSRWERIAITFLSTLFFVLTLLFLKYVVQQTFQYFMKKRTKSSSININKTSN